jgi:hypothetical protein
VRAGRAAAAILFAACVVAGTLADTVRPVARPAGPAILAADFHVHAFPADGALPIWDLQREAGRRGLDVVAITNHNRDLATSLAKASGRIAPYPMVIPGQEVTASRFHMVAIGITRMIDPRLRAADAIAAIHAQGGVAIAAHPVAASWREPDAEALAALDGVEVAHPIMLAGAMSGTELQGFYDRGRRLKPNLAPIGASDFHFNVPIGLCRTFVLADEVSQRGVLDAIRGGRTVASTADGRLIGNPGDVRRVEEYLRGAPSVPASRLATWIALTALAALAAVVVLD